MPKKTSQQARQKTPKKRTPPGKNLMLTLTLVPLVIGVILLGAWVLDLEILDHPPSQVTVGIFFFLLSFTASNALQYRWRLAAGWGLLAVADIITLAWLNIAVQAAALAIGLVGLILLGMEFYRQYQQGKPKAG